MEKLDQKFVDSSCGIYNTEFIDFKKEPIFFGKGKNTQRFEDPKIPFFDKSNDTQQGFDWKHDEVNLEKDGAQFRSILTEAEQFIMTKDFQRLIFFDSAQGRGPMFTFGQLTTLPEFENVVLTWTYFEGCLTPETEVCTNTGWKRIDQITTDDLVLCTDIDGNGKFDHPTEIHKYQSNGYITKFEGKTISQFVTDQHRMLLVNQKGEREVIRVQDLKIHNNKIDYDMVNALTNVVNSSNTLTEQDKLNLLIQHCNYEIFDDIVHLKITLSDENSQSEIRNLFNSLNYEYKIEKDLYNEIYLFSISLDLFNNSKLKNWIQLDKISSDWCKEFNIYLNLWDKDSSAKVSIEDIHMVEIIATIAGYKIARDDNSLQFYSSNISTSDEIEAKRVEYNGSVHCLTVPGNFFVIKHNNKISLTGNCKHSKTYTEQLRALYDNPDQIFDESFNIPELKETSDKISRVYNRTYHLTINYIYKQLNNIPFHENEETELRKQLIRLLIEINAMEGIRFYPSFACFWAIQEGQKLMTGTSENIQFICRDENEHLILTQTLIKILKKNEEEGFVGLFEEMKEEITERFYEIYHEEVNWIKFKFSKGSFLGMNETICIQYLNYITIRRARAVGISLTKDRLDNLWIIKNPIPWIAEYINMDKREKLPQEENITNYITGGINHNLSQKDENKLLSKYIKIKG
jgi:ribonucleotide reductase beta subunit family protein with ferritin-like domain